MEDEDFLLALQLQEQFDRDASASPDDRSPFSKKRKVEAAPGDVAPRWRPAAFRPERPVSIVDESWETLDPSPDVRAIFLQFNDTFFWGKLSGVEVKWSARMTLCAGVCSYEGRGGLCSIRLSEPLLKLRPRRDLVETLLHEMIHALLFVTQNNRDRDGHGPEFCKHMNRINEASGTKISVYHSFHDEVDVYRQHWWRCDGPCQNRKPYFGYVKRAMNRAPSARDPWWADHQRTCGGTYTKVKEPEPSGKKNKAGDKDQKPKQEAKRPSDKGKAPSAAVSSSQDIRNIIPFTGRGFVLGGASSQKPPTIIPTAPPKTQVSPPSSQTSESKALDFDSGLRNSRTGTAGGSSKKSVSNTRAFININGSPVRISKANVHLLKSSGRPSDSIGAKQRSVQDLFQAKGFKSPEKQTSSAFKTATETKSASHNNNSGSSAGWSLNSKAAAPSTSAGSSSSSHKTSGAVGSVSGSADGQQSKYFKSPQKAGTSAPGQKKRSWDNRSAAHIFDFFQRTKGDFSSPRKNSEGKASASVPTVTPPEPAPAVPPSHSVSIASVTVNCPVCHLKVSEAQINAHLDSCLA
ncbi:DNA-dependent metalloprotease SPRTN [Denticeps clupeoides]|uniref:DNA-dependent metalloprotease SPRTN n=1 Tax=Denticeps clupeoides TaxID=299321 RepID=UPI0010A58AAE|nr:sprT-like domain-containing protein Spartan [Denticeps clupeoides]